MLIYLVRAQLQETDYCRLWAGLPGMTCRTRAELVTGVPPLSQSAKALGRVLEGQHETIRLRTHPLNNKKPITQFKTGQTT